MEQELSVDDSSHIASTISTGGGGNVFEQHVGAAFLALLLAKAYLPIHTNAIVTAVKFQQKRNNVHFDDLVAEGTDRNGTKIRIPIQIKRSLTISEIDKECCKTFEAAWKDFNSPETFNQDTDSLLIITYLGTNRLLGDFGALLTQAKISISQEDFASRLTGKGALNKRSKTDYETIRNILSKATGNEIPKDSLWRFLQTLHIQSSDLSSPASKEESWIKSLLHLLRTDESPIYASSNSWNELVVLSGKAAPNGQLYYRNNLPKHLLEAHQEIPASQQNALDTLKNHSEVVLQRIATTNKKGLALKREALQRALYETTLKNQVVLIVGSGGSGKSVLAKQHLIDNRQSEIVFAFAAEEFKAAHIDQVLLLSHVNVSWLALRSLLPLSRKTFLIDGLERLLESDNRNAFIDLMKSASDDPSIQLIITCRDYHAETVERSILLPSGVTFGRIAVPELNDQELQEAENSLPQLTPLLNSPPLKALLRNPFILARVANIDWPANQPLPQTERTLRKRLWDQIVRQELNIRDNLPERRAVAFTKIALDRARSLQPYVEFDGDLVASQLLATDNLLAFDPTKRAAPAHDVFEDWALIEWIESRFHTCEDDVLEFFNAISPFPALRRAYRKWLHEMLESDPSQAALYITAVIATSSNTEIFKDDTLIAVFQSSRAQTFLTDFGPTLLADDARLLTRVIHLVRVACKTVSPLFSNERKLTPMHVPTGNAWPTLLTFIDDHWNKISTTHHRLIIGFIEDWAGGINWQTPYPAGFLAAGGILTKFLPQTRRSYRENGDKERVIRLIIKFPKGAETVFKQLIERSTQKRKGRGNPEDDDAVVFCALITKPFNSYAACRDYPDELIDLFKSRWIAEEPDDDDYSHFSMREIESAFGFISDYEDKMFPHSALQGPFLFLLRAHPIKGIRFILDLANYACSAYASGRFNMEFVEKPWIVNLELFDNTVKPIICNARLWGAFRGMSVSPDILQCALMALEKWLLEMIEFEQWEDNIRDTLQLMLAESNNAAIAAVVASVCIAHPIKSGNTALDILGCREFFSLDLSRCTADPSSLAVGGIDATSKFFQSERLEAKKLTHRSKHLESLALDLQLTESRSAVQAILDRYRSRLPDIKNQNDEDRLWRLALDRMDLRRYDATHIEGTSMIELQMKAPDDDIQELLNESAPDQERFHLLLRMSNWSYKQFNENSGSGEAKAEWPAMLSAAKRVRPELISGEDDNKYMLSGPNMVAAIGVRDHWDSMTEEDKFWCKKVVCEVINAPISEHNQIRGAKPMYGETECASMLALLAKNTEDSPPLDTLIMGLLHFNDEIRYATLDGISRTFVGFDDEAVDFCVKILVYQARRWNEVLQHELTLGWSERRSHIDNWITVVNDTFTAIYDDKLVIETNLEELELSDWPDHQLAQMLMRLFEPHPALPATQTIFSKIVRYLCAQWNLKRTHDSRREKNSHIEFDHAAERSLAKFLMESDPSISVAVSAPIISAINSTPKEVDDIFEWLLAIELDNPGRPSFWPLWSAFSTAIRSAPWQKHLNARSPEGEGIVSRSFLNARWSSNMKYGALGVHYSEIDAHFVNSPRSTVTLDSYCQYLFSTGIASLPDAFILIHVKFGDEIADAITANSNIKFHLELIISRVFFSDISNVRKTRKIREATMKILDALVQAGSSVAFQLRDDFVTPMNTNSQSITPTKNPVFQ